MDVRNLSLLMDFYELTMANSYFENGFQDKIGYFDMFFRSIPEKGGFAIMAGLEQVIDYLSHLSFSEEDLLFLKNKNMFHEGFIDYLRTFHFQCDVWAMEEGTPIFPNEPIVIVRGPIIQAQMVETMILLTVNHQSLIATKANRIVRAAKGRPVMEFGSRRAQGYDGANFGARAAFIGGCVGTANALADKEMNIPALGTMAHSYVQLFSSELEAFRAYARTYPDSCTLLVDTYNVLKSGIPHAIQVFNEELVPKGYRPKGIRIDSGDLTYLSKEARKMLDEAGFPDCMIVASNSLDEYIIEDLLAEGAQINLFGVGERLITSKAEPVFGGVYKLVAIEEAGILIPKIKLSENVAKITNPGFKQVFRFFDKATNKAIADVVALQDEDFSSLDEYELFDPEFTWKRKKITHFYVKKMLVPIFESGKCVYNSKDIQSIQKFCLEELSHLWDSILRFENPHQYYVDLSSKLWQMKTELLYEYSK